MRRFRRLLHSAPVFGTSGRKQTKHLGVVVEICKVDSKAASKGTSEELNQRAGRNGLMPRMQNRKHLNDEALSIRYDF